jgi:hypothetical protein
MKPIPEVASKTSDQVGDGITTAQRSQLSDLPQSREEHEIGWSEPAVGSRHHNQVCPQEILPPER